MNPIVPTYSFTGRVLHPCQLWAQQAGQPDWPSAVDAMKAGQVLVAQAPRSGKTILGLTLFANEVRAEGLHVYVDDFGRAWLGLQENFSESMLKRQEDHLLSQRLIWGSYSGSDQTQDRKAPMAIPTLDSVHALNGRIFATLSSDEHAVFNFYLAQGRKFEVEISIVKDGVAIDLEDAASREEAEAIIKSTNSKISVTVGPGAQEAWLARAAA